MPPREKVGTIATLIVIGLLGALVVRLPTRTWAFHGLRVVVTGKALLGFVLLGLTCAGVQNVIYGHPKGRSLSTLQALLHWILPAALLLVIFAFVIGPSSLERRIVAAIVGSMVLGALIVAEYYITDPEGRWRAPVQFTLRLVAYLLVVLLYLATVGHVAAGGKQLAAVALLGGVFGLYLLTPDRFSRPVAAYTASVGVFLALFSWVLGQMWSGQALGFALVIVVLLYVATGLTQQFFLNKLTWPVALEYAVAGVVILSLLLAYAS